MNGTKIILVKTNKQKNALNPKSDAVATQLRSADC